MLDGMILQGDWKPDRPRLAARFLILFVDVCPCNEARS